MNRVAASTLAFGIVLGLAACSTYAGPPKSSLPTQLGKGELAKAKTTASLFVGAGCFWCIEAQFEMLKGVKEVVSGYAGGTVANPTYQMVMSGRTGHAEAVEIQFDPSVISADDLIRIFFVSHDPTQLNRQGNDVGTQYRSVIFFRNPAEQRRAERIRNEVVREDLFGKPVVTTIESLGRFWRAEEYHQDYYAKFEKATPEERAKMNVGYCQYVVNPKVNEFRSRFAKFLK